MDKVRLTSENCRKRAWPWVPGIDCDIAINEVAHGPENLPVFNLGMN